MQIILEEAPIAKARHRHRRIGNMVMTYDPQKAINDKDKIKLQSAMAQEGHLKLDDGPIFMEVLNYTPIPKSCSQKARIAMDGTYCTKKPDTDNYLKRYSDLLNGIAYSDDRLLSCVYSQKINSLRPRVEISLFSLGKHMINEHAITVNGEIDMDHLAYLVRKANRLGYCRREVKRIYCEEDSGFRHIYFEVTSHDQRKSEDGC